MKCEELPERKNSMDKLKYVKIENDDGSLSENIPIGVDAKNVDVNIAGGVWKFTD